MIDLSLSEEQALAQKVARNFGERRLVPALREHEATGVSTELEREFVEIGWADVQEDLGGAGLGAFEQAIILEELGASDAGATLALDRLGPARYLLGDTTEDENRALLREGRLALVVDRDRRLALDEGRVRGTVAWCPCSDPTHVVVARGDAVWVVDAREMRVAPARGLAFAASSLDFGGARARVVPCDAAPRLASVALYQSALLVGLTRAAYEYTARYVRERVAFGRPLAQHQAIAFMVVEMAMATDAARLSTWRAAHEIARLGAGSGDTEKARWAAEAALDEAAESALAMTERAVQLLGGHGYLKDHPVEKWMREARALTLAWGYSPARG